MFLGAVRAQPVHDPRDERHVRAGEDRDADGVRVLLDRGLDDLLRRLVETGVDDLHTRVRGESIAMIFAPRSRDRPIRASRSPPEYVRPAHRQNTAVRLTVIGE